MSENPSLRKNRLLTQALILSGMLNIGLLSTFIYAALQEKQEALAIELKPAKEQSSSMEHLSNAALLRAYSLLPFQELLLRLENKEHVEEGINKRDLALTCLTAFHHFHLDKALYGVPLQRRNILFPNESGQEKIELPLYPGLSDDQFQAIMRYAKTEKWPLNAQGLFYELQRSPLPRDSTLIEAFCLSTEYQTAHTLFFKTGIPISAQSLIDVLCEGDWNIITAFTQAQRNALDLSLDRRRSFLLAYLHMHSKTAAKLLLETDGEWILKRCDDSEILTLFDLYEEKSDYLAHFAKALLAAPRTDTVYKRAAITLYALAQEAMPDPYDHRIAMDRFLPKDAAAQPASSPKETPPSPKTGKKLYVVENGDNLWKISRKFRVSIDEIMKVNHLETEKLRPGKQLEIPVKEIN
jgi:LysM repeat protein